MIYVVTSGVSAPANMILNTARAETDRLRFTIVMSRHTNGSRSLEVYASLVVAIIYTSQASEDVVMVRGNVASSTVMRTTTVLQRSVV